MAGIDGVRSVMESQASQRSIRQVTATQGPHMAGADRMARTGAERIAGMVTAGYPPLDAAGTVGMERVDWCCFAGSAWPGSIRQHPLRHFTAGNAWRDRRGSAHSRQAWLIESRTGPGRHRSARIDTPQQDTAGNAYHGTSGGSWSRQAPQGDYGLLNAGQARHGTTAIVTPTLASKVSLVTAWHRTAAFASQAVRGQARQAWNCELRHRSPGLDGLAMCGKAGNATRRTAMRRMASLPSLCKSSLGMPWCAIALPKRHNGPSGALFIPQQKDD